MVSAALQSEPLADRPERYAGLDAFLTLAEPEIWHARIREIRGGCTPGHAGRAFARLHAVELLADRLIRIGARPATLAERVVATSLSDIAILAATLGRGGRDRLCGRLREALSGTATLIPLLHIVHYARIQRDRGFSVYHAGLAEGAPYDLLLSRDGSEAEVACETISAEEGRDVHRSAWSYLVDRVDPDLQTWLSAHPGRYLLKMTLPRGLKQDIAQTPGAALAALHGRISRLLSESRRADHDEAAVLRLEPLLLAGAQAGELGLMQGLRREFGHEAHLAVTASGGGVFVMAARAAREDEVAEAMQRRMAARAPERLTGTRPGILAMLIEDTDHLEWRVLREQLRLEGAARQFLTSEQARSVVAVTCMSRLELLGGAPPDAAEGGELRFRSPAHPSARALALAPAIAPFS